MNSKDKILDKLKKNDVYESKSVPPLTDDKKIFKDYPNKELLVDMFVSKFKALSGEIHFVKNMEEASLQLDLIIYSLENKNCITFSSELINKLFSYNAKISQYFKILSNEYLDSNSFASYSASLTTADILIARTGSIIINSLDGGGRRVSVLPPIHIVVAETTQIVSSLDEIFNNEFVSADWSYATIISGPSRTSDIEKQLVLGAHGPKRLILILIQT
jgi:L-lactate dehydrogenase complex protein LldG